MSHTPDDIARKLTLGKARTGRQDTFKLRKLSGRHNTATRKKRSAGYRARRKVGPGIGDVSKLKAMKDRITGKKRKIIVSAKKRVGRGRTNLMLKRKYSPAQMRKMNKEVKTGGPKKRSMGKSVRYRKTK